MVRLDRVAPGARGGLARGDLLGSSPPQWDLLRGASALLVALVSAARPAYGGPSEVQLENLTLTPTATLEIEIAGTQPGSEFDAVGVENLAMLAGTLRVLLLDGFVPGVAQSFEFLTAGTVTGGFDALELPSLPQGRAFELSQTATSLTLSVAPVSIPALQPLGSLGLALLLAGSRARSAARGVHA